MSINFPTIQPKSLLIVDSLNLAFRYKHAGAKNFLTDYQRTVESLRASFKCEKIVLACDSGSSSFRKAFYPEYKSARKEKFEKQTEEEKEEFEEFFNEFNETIDTLREDYLVLKFDKCEADDIAANIVTNRKNFDISKIWLASSDKDWDLLINKYTSRFSYVTRKEITLDNWNTHYGFPVEAYLDIKCLMGDSGDSIKGPEGIGPKRAVALIEEYGSVYDIIESMPISSRYKYIQNLNTFGVDNLKRNIKLMDLITYNEEALGEENCTTIKQQMLKYLT